MNSISRPSDRQDDGCACKRGEEGLSAGLCLRPCKGRFLRSRFLAPDAPEIVCKALFCNLRAAAVQVTARTSAQHSTLEAGLCRALLVSIYAREALGTFRTRYNALYRVQASDFRALHGAPTWHTFVSPDKIDRPAGQT